MPICLGVELTSTDTYPANNLQEGLLLEAALEEVLQEITRRGWYSDIEVLVLCTYDTCKDEALSIKCTFQDSWSQ